MAKAKSPKTTDTNEAASKITAQPSVPSPAGETPASFAPATSTTKAETTKPKATRSRAAKSSAATSAATPSASPASQSPVSRLEAVPNEGRTNGESRANGDAQKSEGRRNLVPINLEDEIRKVAYLLSERRGFAAGHEREDWLTAEREVLQRYRQQQRA